MISADDTNVQKEFDYLSGKPSNVVFVSFFLIFTYSPSFLSIYEKSVFGVEEMRCRG
jgi:hypothetical protein